MNKHGFTLIEIIVTITLLALLAIVVGTNFIGLANKQKETEYQRNVTEIVDAAKTYVGLNKNGSKDKAKSSGTINVTLGELITEGLVDENISDPRTENNEPIFDESKPNAKYVKVTYSSGTFTYDFIS